MSKLPPPENDSERLDRILFHIERMDGRDKLRTFGGFFRNIIMLAPALLIIWSTWYFFQHSDEIMRKIATVAAEQAQEASQGQVDSLLKQLQELPAGRTR